MSHQHTLTTNTSRLLIAALGALYNGSSVVYAGMLGNHRHVPRDIDATMPWAPRTHPKAPSSLCLLAYLVEPVLHALIAARVAAGVAAVVRSPPQGAAAQYCSSDRWRTSQTAGIHGVS